MDLVLVILFLVSVWILLTSVTEAVEDNGLISGLIITVISVWMFVGIIAYYFK